MRTESSTSNEKKKPSPTARATDSSAYATNGDAGSAEKMASPHVSAISDKAKKLYEDALEAFPGAMTAVTAFGKTIAESFVNAKTSTVQSTIAAAKAIDKQVKARPWTFLGCSAVAGFAAGYLLGSRSSSISSSGLPPFSKTSRRSDESSHDLGLQ